jgi:hypothetical protein
MSSAAPAGAATNSEVTGDTGEATDPTKPSADSDDGCSIQHGSSHSSTSSSSTSSSSGDGDQGDVPLFQFLTGIRDDLSARLPIYKDDWRRPDNMFTVINATFFAFVIQLIPALIFAELMNRETEGNLATAEV